MSGTSPSFARIATELAHLYVRRENVVNDAFDAFVDRCPALAGLLVEGLGCRRRAATWLGVRQRVFAGRTAWDLLAEGDEESVRDAVWRLAHFSRDEGDPLLGDRLHAA